MERIIRFDIKQWSRSVYSAIRDAQAQAGYDRACRSAFTAEGTDEGDFLIPPGCDYFSEEGRCGLTSDEKRELALERFEREIYWITSQEESLLKLLLIGDGSVPFVPPMVPVAEGLIKRCWCHVGYDGNYLLKLQDGMAPRLADKLQSPAFALSRHMMFRLEAIIFSIVFIYGYANLSLTADMIFEAVTQTGVKMDVTGLRRSAKALADYIRRGSGGEYLIHPALRDPEKLMAQSLNYWNGNMAITIRNLQGGMNACLPTERESVEAANKFLAEMSRNDPELEHLPENVYYMFKQGASLDEAEEYLSPKLSFAGSRQLRSILIGMKRDIIPWGAAVGGVDS